MPDSASSRENCKKCGSVFVPHTPGTPTCTVCIRYASMVSNSKRVRRDGSCPGLDISLFEFAEWLDIENREMCCEYCGVDESSVIKLGAITQAGHPLQRLGMDRIEGDQGYTVDNIVLCCFPCNKARSNTFTAQEMRDFIGPGIALVWEQRLSEAGAD